MGKATLSYFVDDKKFVIYSDTLTNIDKYTCEMKNEKELFENVPKTEFLSYYTTYKKNRGSFKITFVDEHNEIRKIPVLYNQKPIEIDDIAKEGIVSESEKARRNLLNSEEQLYSKLFLLNKDVNKAKKLSVVLTRKDKLLLDEYGIYTFEKNGYYAVSIEDLIRFRSTHKKLKDVRPIYEEALDLWKEKMDNLSYDDIYFLSREYRLINTNYNRIRENGLSVSNLDINKKRLGVLRRRVNLDTISPLMIRPKNKKNKVMNKAYYQ